MTQPPTVPEELLAVVKAARALLAALAAGDVSAFQAVADLRHALAELDKQNV